MSTQLHDLMHDAVRETHPDLDALVDRARRRGLGIRRRRQSLSLVGAALAVTGIVAGSFQLGGDPGTDGMVTTTPTTAPSVSATPTPDVGRQVPMTGRSVAAGLRQAVHDAVGPFHNGVGDFKGQSSSDEAYAELHYDPSDHGGFSLVGLNVQPGFAEKEIYRCKDWQVDCRVLHPTEGATLMTYEEHSQTPEGLGIRVVADLLRADGVRVVASSSNGEEVPANHWNLTRDRPPLTATQLYLVVSEPWWGPTMDERFADAGTRLTPYTDLDADRGDWLHGNPSTEP